jgi:hypothetical protein
MKQAARGTLLVAFFTVAYSSALKLETEKKGYNEQRSTCSLHIGFLYGLLFGPEYGGEKFFRKLY